MKNLPAKDRLQKVVKDIGSYLNKARDSFIVFAWSTGKRIFEEEQDGEMRAAYGKKLIPQISQALTLEYGRGFSENSIWKMRQFFIQNPILPNSRELVWSDYLELLPVKDTKIRKRLKQKIIKENLNVHEIREIVHAENKKTQNGSLAITKKIPPLKKPSNLVLGTFSPADLKVKVKEGYVMIDCGFFVNWPVKKEMLKKLTIVKEMSYTYTATVDRVIDGDTLLVLIDIGFGIVLNDRLRLRGINAPEVKTPEGNRAKNFVEKILPSGSTIIVKSSKSKIDVYGRFVVDVLFHEKQCDAQYIIDNGIHLNQHLIDNGHAGLLET